MTDARAGAADPFAHHPDLRDKITPADTSFFREFTKDRLRVILAEHGLEEFPFHDDATREALRRGALTGRDGQDIWVFGYGSLIWDPALLFADVRRAFAPDHARRFILKDIYGGRGTREAPGLMAALDDGDGCHGLAFRLTAKTVDRETEILCRRELLGPGYHIRFIPIEIDGMRTEALTFVADHDAELIAHDITRSEQIAYAATGTGFLGHSYDYLTNVVDHLHDMSIPDPDLDALLADVDAYRARRKEQ